MGTSSPTGSLVPRNRAREVSKAGGFGRDVEGGGEKERKSLSTHAGERKFRDQERPKCPHYIGKHLLGRGIPAMPCNR